MDLDKSLGDLQGSWNHTLRISSLHWVLKTKKRINWLNSIYCALNVRYHFRLSKGTSTIVHEDGEGFTSPEQNYLLRSGCLQPTGWAETKIWVRIEFWNSVSLRHIRSKEAGDWARPAEGTSSKEPTLLQTTRGNSCEKPDHCIRGKL